MKITNNKKILITLNRLKRECNVHIIQLISSFIHNLIKRMIDYKNTIEIWNEMN